MAFYDQNLHARTTKIVHCARHHDCARPGGSTLSPACAQPRWCAQPWLLRAMLQRGHGAQSCARKYMCTCK